MSSFVLYPAIDVRGGRVVRLRQGDYAQETRYADDPLAVAERYAQAGARWLHLVDLDAARAGGYTLAPLLSAIKSATSLQVQTGGGVRGEADVQSILEAGADRVHHHHIGRGDQARHAAAPALFAGARAWRVGDRVGDHAADRIIGGRCATGADGKELKILRDDAARKAENKCRAERCRFNEFHSVGLPKIQSERAASDPCSDSARGADPVSSLHCESMQSAGAHGNHNSAQGLAHTALF